jgi:hypothetical protein
MGSDPHDRRHYAYHKTGSSDNDGSDSNSEARRKMAARSRGPITEITIGYIETVTMTEIEYADAVESLAVLIARYERHHDEQPGTAA